MEDLKKQTRFERFKALTQKGLARVLTDYSDYVTDKACFAFEKAHGGCLYGDGVQPHNCVDCVEWWLGQPEG